MTTENQAMRPPGPDEYFEYYGKYVQQVPSGNILERMEAQIVELRAFLDNVSEADAMVCHPPYTWTVKQVVGHLIDVERIFGDRLHRFAFGDMQALPGMEQDAYVANADFETPTLKSLVDELLLCRQANLLLLRRVKLQAWDNRGVASDHPVTVRALAWMLVGHIIHHLKIVRTRLRIGSDR